MSLVIGHPADRLRAIALHWLRKIGWFGVVGLVSSAIYAGGVATGIDALGLDRQSANAMAFMMSAISSYIGHHRFTFRGDSNHHRHIPKFLLQAVTTYLMAAAATAAVAAFGLHYAVSIVTVVVVIPIFNFLVLQFWVFSHKRTEGAAMAPVSPSTPPSTARAMPSPSSQNQSAFPPLSTLLAWAGLLLFAALCVWRIYQNPFDLLWSPAIEGAPFLPTPLSIVMNSDQLTPVSVVWDLMRNWRTPENLAGWQLSRAPYIFPDITTHLALTQFIPSFRIAVFVQVIGQIMLFAAAQTWIICRLARVPAVVAATLSALTLVPHLVFHTVDVLYFQRIGFFAFFLGNHFSAFLMGLVATVLLLDLTGRLAVWRLLALGVLSVLSTVSNQLFAVYFTLPALTGLLAVAVLRKDRRLSGGVIGACLLAATGIAFQLDAYVPRQPTVDLEITVSLGWLIRAATPLWGFVQETPWGGALFFGLPLVTLGGLLPLGLLVWFVRRLTGTPGPCSDVVTQRFLFLIIVAVSVPLTFAAYLTTTLGQAQNLRYLIPVIYLLPLVLAIGAACGWQRRVADTGADTGGDGRQAGRRWLAGLGGIVAVLLAMVLTAHPRVPELLRWAPPEAASLLECRDRLGLRAGLSEYWLSRYLMAGTGWRMQVNQVFDQEPRHARHWGNSLSWYIRDFADPAAVPDYNFIIANKLNRAAIRHDYGPPDRTATCGLLEIWIYDRPGHLYDRLLAGSPELSRLVIAQAIRDHRDLVIKGWTLPGIIGAVDGEGRTASQGRDPAGVLSFGPYIDLPPGRYRLRIGYESEGAPGHNRFDIAVDNGRGVVYAGPLPEKDADGAATVLFDLPAGGHRLEVRMVYDGIGRLTIRSLAFMRTADLPAEPPAKP